VGSKAMLAGSISPLGRHYVIGLDALNCATGDILDQQQVEASGKEEVLRVLGDAAGRMRRKLGESLASVDRFTTPIAEATTPSLEALKAYSMGRQAVLENGDLAGLPYHKRAIELDPDFATAHAALAVAYNNLGQETLAREHATRAFELRERVSERERYRTSALYYSFVTGELDWTIEAYELWRQSYPRDWVPVVNLGNQYHKLGQWESALEPTQVALELEPNSALVSANLAEVQHALGRLEDARSTLDQAFARGLESMQLHLSAYEAAFLRGDEEAMREQVSWAAKSPRDEHWLYSMQSDTDAYFGRLATARELSQRAIDSARRSGAGETAALAYVHAALREAEFGNLREAHQSAMAGLALASGKDVRDVGALALARAGYPDEAQQIADSLNRDFPRNTIVQGYWLPAIRAAIEIHGENASRALDILQAATPYELSQSQPAIVGMMYPAYLRGEAWLLARRGRDAATEFRKLLDHRGIVLNFPLGALARLGLARALSLAGDQAGARRAYEEFLDLWKGADPDIPVLRQARAEYARLQ